MQAPAIAAIAMRVWADIPSTMGQMEMEKAAARKDNRLFLPVAHA
jgi:hypothetical protein